jgi:hypothetical protein
MKSISTALAAGALAAAGALSTGIAAADEPAPAPATQPIGTQGAVPEGPGVHGWTVNDLRPSSDAIPYQPRGTLWEATATDEAIQGTVFPIVANLSARSASGQNYQSLFTVPTSQGIVPTGLTQGQQTSGKVYFDVTGDAPNSMVYQAGGADLIRWVAPAPQQAPPSAPQPQAPTGGSGSQAPAANGGGSHQAPAPARGPSSHSANPGPATPPAGSSGTPLPEGSSGTPLPAEAPDSSASSSSGSAGTPAASP